jgi:outer membrane protein
MMKNWLLFLICIVLITDNAFMQEKSLSLQECIQVALDKNPQLRISQFQQKAAQEGIRMSYGNILPRAGLSSSATRSTQGASEYIFNNVPFVKGDTTTSYFEFGLGLQQNIYNGRKSWNTVKLARSEYNQTNRQGALLTQEIIANVTEKFYSLLKAQELVKVYQVALQNSQEQLKKSDEMFRIGQVAKKDLYKAQVNEGNARLNVIQQQAQVKLALDNLKEAMGMTADLPLAIAEENYQLPQVLDREVAVQQALQHNPNLQILHIQKESALLNYKIARGDLFPDITASFGYNRSGPEMSRLYSDFDKWWNTSLSLNISYPIFQGFYRKANIQQKYLNYKTYDDQIIQQRLELINQIDNLLLSINTYLQMIEINELNIASAKEDLRLQQEMYRLNAATLLEVLDAQVALTRAQGNLISIKYDAKIAEVKLALLIGTL